MTFLNNVFFFFLVVFCCQERRMVSASSPSLYLVSQLDRLWSKDSDNDSNRVLTALKTPKRELLYLREAMPRYELSLILKAMHRKETAATLRRTVETLMERGAVIRDLENLGERQLPYKICRHSQRHVRGAYFLIDFYSAPNIIIDLLNYLHRDVDVVRPAVLKKEEQGPQSTGTCCGLQM